MAKRKPELFEYHNARGSFTITLRAIEEVDARLQAGLRTLPDAWYEPGVTERMGAYLKRELDG